MGNKEKGANVERELLHMLMDKKYMAIRVAGSGILPEPSCDLIVGKFNKKFAIECKSSKKEKRYIDSKQISNFLIFSEIFGLKPLLAIRFNRKGWYFLDLGKRGKTKAIENTGKGLAISLESAQKYGKRFEEIFN